MTLSVARQLRLLSILESLRTNAGNIEVTRDSGIIDTELGQLLFLIAEARSLIDDQWRENRINLKPLPRETTLEDLI